MRRYERYVALGDSTTEGLMDSDGRGGFRGWADRFAERLAAHQGGLSYANLAVRGRGARGIREGQLEAALALEPDLVSAMVGMNDLIAPRFALDEVSGDLETIVRALTAGGATLIMFTLPDLSSIAPIARLVQHRNRALNAEVRAVAGRTRATLVDLAAIPLAADPRMWAPDRLHANAEGHARLGHTVARALGVPGDDSWSSPLPPPPPLTLRERARIELGWAREYLVPWAVRTLRGQSMGDTVTAKRPRLEPVAPDRSES